MHTVVCGGNIYFPACYNKIGFGLNALGGAAAFFVLILRILVNQSRGSTLGGITARRFGGIAVRGIGVLSFGGIAVRHISVGHYLSVTARRPIFRRAGFAGIKAAEAARHTAAEAAEGPSLRGEGIGYFAGGGNIYCAARYFNVPLGLYCVPFGFNIDGSAAYFHGVVGVESVVLGFNAYRAFLYFKLIVGTDAVVIVSGYGETAAALYFKVGIAEHGSFRVRSIIFSVRKKVFGAFRYCYKAFFAFFKENCRTVRICQIHSVKA